MTTHLIIPDAHAKPSAKNHRFSWLGNLIVDVKPDVVVCLGDFADMYSLNSYEKGLASFHGASYKEDIEAALDAQDRLFQPLKRAKRKKPRFVMLGGNHEDRINKVLNRDNHLSGAISYRDLDYERRWEFHDFLEKVNIDGVNYSHFIKSGNSGNAMAGIHHAAGLLRQEHCSTTVGHSHLLDYKIGYTGQSQRIHGLAAGCFFDHEEAYAFPNDRNWWRGITVKRCVRKGDYDAEFISLAQLKEAYK